MTYPSWPVGLPQAPLVDSYQRPDMYQDPRVTDMEGGNKRMLTRPGDDIYRVTFNLLMSRTQATTFRTWVLTDLGRGTSRFSTRIWDGSSMVNAVCQFASKPVESSVVPLVMFGLDFFVFPGLS